MKERVVIPSRDLPVLPLRNTLLFPGQVIPVVVGRTRSRAAVEAALEKDRLLVLLAQRHEIDDREPTPDDLYRVGLVARVENHMQHEGGRSHQLVLMGICRFEVSDLRAEKGMLLAAGAPLEDQIEIEDSTIVALTQNAKLLARDIFQYLPPSLAQFAGVLDNTSDTVLLSHMISQHLDIKLARKQELLETVAVKPRFLKLLEIMAHWRDDLKLQHEIQQKVSGKLGKQQREALLREQIRALQDELGEGKSPSDVDYRGKVKQAGMSAEIEKIALEQLTRLEQLPQASPEVHVIRNYLDLLVALPWKAAPALEIDLPKAEQIMHEEHYGLEKIKKRILQHLAVMKLKPEKRGSILLLVGPPGVGKTSLAKSIASALQRPYVRVSLGGVRDDAEIRGHRRTYVGALPGRIIDGIKRAGQNNPVFVLDEIDKMARGWGGDPASAMLEVLDPEQNRNFLDHYLDVPFDLSQVFFVATANSLESIPAPLLDRMEVIPVSGYTISEKLHIAKRHLWPKQLDEHGLKVEDVSLSDEVLLKIIGSYTREAGVRELQRHLGAIARLMTERKVRQAGTDHFVHPVSVTLADLEEVLDVERFVSEASETRLPPGVVTGLAWTPMGGDILFIESHVLQGKGQLTLTGQLGDVMKESAQIAWTLVRSRLSALQPERAWDKVDVHLHVPAGAIPKDGPSAGVTMLTALSSLLLGKAVDPKLAMTGEITLRGAVTPVGGIKEKLIAAHRAGIQRVILSRRNQRDLKDVPSEVLESLKIDFVDTVDELLTLSLGVTSIQPAHQARFDSPVNFA
ncbi:MAG: endopeptidase La [Bdellovibrionales bacterium]